MLDFLTWITNHQPSRNLLENFFTGRRMPRDLPRAVRQAMDLEQHTRRTFSFLTVTNRGAAALNAARVRAEFPAAEAMKQTHGVPVDPAQCTERLVFLEGMQIRLTRNLDKDRGFVNGALGTVKKVLNRQTFVVETPEGVLLLVHAVCDRRKAFLPATHGYAMTIRRAQGCTLEFVGLHFDRRRADRGYAYVGASRARRKVDVHLVGRIRRTDWLPVGGDLRGDEYEQQRPGPQSESTDIDEHCISDSNDCRDDRASSASISSRSGDERGGGFARARRDLGAGQGDSDDLADRDERSDSETRTPAAVHVEIGFTDVPMIEFEDGIALAGLLD